MWQLGIGYVADILLGDPYWLPHPVRFIGKLISTLEKIFIGEKKDSFDDNADKINCQGDCEKNNNIRKHSPHYKKIAGVLLLIIVTSVSYLIPFYILRIASAISVKLSIMIEAMMIYQILATKCLAVEAQKVAGYLRDNDLPSARTAIGYLVSRDTHIMDEADIVKATVETISENTIDGIVSPIFFIIIGGAPLGWAFKAVNTLDSMVGYKNERYIDFGLASARFDDLLNFIPARITAVFTFMAAFILGLDVNNAWKIFMRDRYNHASPNSAIAESVTAGALDIQLGGRASYFGEISDKLTMGDPIEMPRQQHITYTIQMMYVVSFLAVICSFLF